MKKVYLIFLFLIIHNTSFGCECLKRLSFLKGSQSSDIVLLGKVINRQYKFSPDITFNTKEEIEKYYSENKGKVFYHLEILEIETIEIIRGSRQTSIIKIYGGNSNSCWGSLDMFTIGKQYIFSLNETIPAYNFSKEKTEFGFELGICHNSWLEFNPKNKTVRGVLGKKRIKTLSYRKLIDKIT